MQTKRWFLGLSLLAAFFGCGGAVTTDDSVSSGTQSLSTEAVTASADGTHQRLHHQAERQRADLPQGLDRHSVRAACTAERRMLLDRPRSTDRLPNGAVRTGVLGRRFHSVRAPRNLHWFGYRLLRRRGRSRARRWRAVQRRALDLRVLPEVRSVPA